MESEFTEMSVDHSLIGKRLLQMKTDSVLTDIMISCGKVTFSAHKSVLSNCSLFFNMIFADGIKQTKPNADFDQLNMDIMGVDGEVFESVVDFMYSGSIKLNMHNFTDIVKAADYLVMKDLTEVALNYLRLKLEKENCLKLYLSVRNCELSLESSCDIVTTIWEKVESSFFDFIVVQEEFLQVYVEDMNVILSKGIRKGFNSFNLLTFIHRWLKARQDENALEIAESFINQFIELRTGNNETHEEKTKVDGLMQEIIDFVKEKLEMEPESGECLHKILDRLAAESNTYNASTDTDTDDRESLTDTVSLMRKQCEKDQKIASSSMVIQNPSEDVGNGKSAKSLTTSLEKIRVKAFEKSVQERVKVFLEDQMSYTQVRPKPFSRKSGNAAGSLKWSPWKRGKNSLDHLEKAKKRKMSKPIIKAKVKRNRKGEAPMIADWSDEEVTEFDNNDEGVDGIIDVGNDDYAMETNSQENGGESFDEVDNDFFHAEVQGIISGLTNPVKATKHTKRRKGFPVRGESEILKDYTLKEKLIELIKHPNKLENQCIICKTEYTRGSHLVRHMVQKHSDEIFDCVKCGESFEDAKEYVTHSRSHLTEWEEKFIEETGVMGQREFKCVICNKGFGKVLSAKSHLSQHRVIFGKKEKGLDFDDANERKNTKTSSPKQTSFQCDICSNTFTRKDHLNRHTLCQHSDKFPHVCQICGKKFKLRYQLTEHTTLHTDGDKAEDEKSVLCYICGATMKSQKYLKRHLNTHTETQKRYTCTVCDKSYSQSITLQVHMRKHTGVKPFQCEICSMLFAVKSNMLRHQRRHRGEKRYKCDQCGKGFLMVGDLKRHYTTHTGEKNYSCKFCGKRFNCRSKVPQHERIHTGEKPYACQVCGKRFIQSGDRKRHEATHGNQLEDKKRRLTLFEIANPGEQFDPMGSKDLPGYIPIDPGTLGSTGNGFNPAGQGTTVHGSSSTAHGQSGNISNDSVNLSMETISNPKQSGNNRQHIPGTVSANQSHDHRSHDQRSHDQRSHDHRSHDQRSHEHGPHDLSHDSSGNKEIQLGKPEPYNLERAVNTIIDYAMTDRVVQQAIASQVPYHHPDNKPSSSFQTHVPSQRDGKEAGPFGRLPAHLQHGQSQNLPASVTMAPGPVPMEEKMKVVVVPNSSHLQSYDSYDHVPNHQIYYLQKE